MRIAILGAGAIAYGAAAYLLKRGHEPDPLVALRPNARASSPRASRSSRRALSRESSARGWRRAAATRSSGADAIFVALPANGHRVVFDAAAPHIEPGQVVVISGHLSFGALYLARKLADRGLQIPIIAWGTTVTTGRQLGPTQVKIANIRKKVDVATVPTRASKHGLAVCQELFGDRFVPRSDLLAISVSNLNPQNHMGIAILNLTRMERGEAWGQSQNLTDAVGTAA